MGLNENNNQSNDLSNSNNQLYLKFTQIGQIIIEDNKKYFQCKSDGETFPIKIKSDYRSQDTDIVDKIGCFSIIPICDGAGTILSYHIVELEREQASEVFIIQGRVRQTIRRGTVQLLVKTKRTANLTIPVQTNNQFKMNNSTIYLCHGYREKNQLHVSNYALITEKVIDEKTKVFEQVTISADNYVEVVASDHNGVLIYIPTSQLESIQWRPVEKKYKLVKSYDGFKIINAAPVNVNDTQIDVPKTCQYCIYGVNSICSQPKSPFFLSTVKNDSTCIKCTV
ncbi:hypothetical protein CAL7716_057840 [Calothrix sp. PCC 7716]|nr:hypothetical protein CAL7716_057840 [Calothrix sp. PCC 7716]